MDYDQYYLFKKITYNEDLNSLLKMTCRYSHRLTPIVIVKTLYRMVDLLDPTPQDLVCNLLRRAICYLEHRIFELRAQLKSRNVVNILWSLAVIELRTGIIGRGNHTRVIGILFNLIYHSYLTSGELKVIQWSHLILPYEDRRIYYLSTPYH